MIETAERNERLLGVVFQWRFTPEFIRIKALLEQGKLGKPFLAVMISFWWRTNEYFKVWWRGTWEKECGGSVLNHAIHHIDFLLGLMGDVLASPPGWVCSLTRLKPKMLLLQLLGLPMVLWVSS
jgi:predicted dehydrogenase